MQSIKTSLKGIVHPQMKILLLITHPHVVPNPYDKTQTNMFPY